MQTRRSPEHGFSLIEALLGLTLIGVTLLFTMSLVAQQPGVERRLAAHREALFLVEGQLEAMRASLVVPEDGEIELDEDMLEILKAAEQMRLWVEVESLPPRFLYQVEVKARYAVTGEFFELKVDSMIWTP